MNAFRRTLTQMGQKGAGAFRTYPAPMLNALAFSVVTLIRIRLDWPEQLAWNFLFNCLHWSFAAGAAAGLALVTAARRMSPVPGRIRLAHMAGLVVPALVFLALYFTGTVPEGESLARVGQTAAARTGVLILLSLVAFILLVAQDREYSVSRSLFMFQKSLVIALIYGGVIMAGSSGVAGAVQALLYNDMSEKVFMVIATLAGLITWTMFLGYFPDFTRDTVDPRREITEKQPRFVEILLGYILVPVILALAVVLILWVARNTISGFQPEFSGLFRITLWFALGGLWLHVMISEHAGGLVSFYRKAFPPAALVILAFSARSLVFQLGRFGLMTAEYFFILVWLLAVVSLILILWRKAAAHRTILLLLSALTVLAVFPFVGFTELPVRVQGARLETLLIREGLLSGDELIPAATEPEEEVRRQVTVMVQFLAGSRQDRVPEWFRRDLSQPAAFRESFGFEQKWPDYDLPGGGSGPGLILQLPPSAVDISGYRWAVHLQEDTGMGRSSVSFEGERGTYVVDWTMNPALGPASIEISLEGREILSISLKEYADLLMEEHSGDKQADPGELTIVRETPEIRVMLILRFVEVHLDPGQDEISYWMDPNTLYVQEK